MNPITTFKDLGAIETLLRKSERTRIAAHIRKIADSEGDHAEFLYILAHKIEHGEHWN